MKYKSKILFTSFVTHDVRRLIVEKPKRYIFKPGQATEVAINKRGWTDKKHPFTFTSLNSDKVLEFIIKGYPLKKFPDHVGMTEKVHKLKPGDELLFDDPWGAISYGGPGVFIAGGAGITPFIAIIRDLSGKGKLKGSTLIFSNKKFEDIILERELRSAFGDRNLFLTLTREKKSGYLNGRVDKDFLKNNLKSFRKKFYVCGPKNLVRDFRNMLEELGAETSEIIFEN